MVVYHAGGERTFVQSVTICLAISIQYVCVTDGQTDILRQHSPHYVYALRRLRGKKRPKTCQSGSLVVIVFHLTRRQR